MNEKWFYCFYVFDRKCIEFEEGDILGWGYVFLEGDGLEVGWVG